DATPRLGRQSAPRTSPAESSAISLSRACRSPLRRAAFAGAALLPPGRRRCYLGIRLAHFVQTGRGDDCLMQGEVLLGIVQFVDGGQQGSCLLAEFRA